MGDRFLMSKKLTAGYVQLEQVTITIDDVTSSLNREPSRVLSGYLRDDVIFSVDVLLLN